MKEIICLENFVKDIRQMKHYNEWLESEDNTKADGWHFRQRHGMFLLLIKPIILLNVFIRPIRAILYRQQ